MPIAAVAFRDFVAKRVSGLLQYARVWPGGPGHVRAGAMALSGAWEGMAPALRL